MNNSAKPHVVACVIVRMKSTRLPKKAFADVGGKPMTARIIERLKSAETIDEIVVCTSDHPDDAVLLDLAKDCGVGAIAGSQDNVLARFQQVARERGADIVLRVTGDNVFTCPRNIDRMVRSHIELGADYTRTNGLPWGVTAEVMSADMLDRLEAAIPDLNQSEYMTLWAFDPDRFRCQALEAPEDERRPFYSLTVDTPEDLALAQRLFNDLAKSETGPSIRDIVAALDADPDYKGIDPEAPIKLPKGERITFSQFMDWFAERAQRARAKITEY